jgi:hypothetical protein
MKHTKHIMSFSFIICSKWADERDIRMSRVKDIDLG